MSGQKVIKLNKKCPRSTAGECNRLLRVMSEWPKKVKIESRIVSVAQLDRAFAS